MSFRYLTMHWLCAVALIAALDILSNTSQAQPQKPQDTAKAMLVLDASGSMWGKVEGKHKIAIARQVVSDLMRDWDPSVQLGLTAYGHRKKGDCKDIEMLMPVGAGTARRIPGIVKKISPKGKTPLSDAVRRAAENLRYTEDPATVILVTDGLETCKADPCAVAKALEETGVDFTAHVIGFDLTEEQGASVRCIADKTGGKYYSARSAADLRRAIGSAVEASKPARSDKVRLALVEGGPLLTSGNADFRFFAVDAQGNPTPKQLAQNYGHVGFAEVPAGNHAVTVKYGLADASATIKVARDGTEHVIVLNAGIVRLNAILGAKTLGLSYPLKWTVRAMRADGQPAHRDLTSNLDSGAGALFVLKPGKYVIRAKISGVSRNLPISVEAGDEIDLEVEMHSGTLNLRALLSPGGPQAKAQPYFNWLAFSADENGAPKGKPLVGSLFSAPRFVLPAGKNVISFEDRAVKRQFEVNVPADQTVNLDLVINAGILNYRVVDASGAPVEGYPVVEFYPRGAQKNLANRLGYFDRTFGQVYIPAEPLDAVVKLKGKTHSWRVELAPGETQNVTFEIAQ